MYLKQLLSRSGNTIFFALIATAALAIVSKHKSMSGQLEELAGVVKLEFIHRSVIYKGGGDLRMYDHGFIYTDICYLYVA